MVSPLSSRLLGLNSAVVNFGGSSSTGSSSGSISTGSSSSGPNSPPEAAATIHHHHHQSRKYHPIKPRVSGYSADREISSLASGASSFKDQRAQDVSDRCKKRKHEEVAYAASTVKADLERANKAKPHNNPFRAVVQQRGGGNRPRALPTMWGSVDMSGAVLVRAGQENDPFLAAASASSAPQLGDGDDDSASSASSLRRHLTSASSYAALLESVSSFYAPPAATATAGAPAPPGGTEDDATDAMVTDRVGGGGARPLDARSGTSTATPSASSDVESDDSGSQPGGGGSSAAAVVIPPRLEQGTSMLPSPSSCGGGHSFVPEEFYSEQRNNNNFAPPSTTTLMVNKTSSSLSTDIEKALSYSPKPRLVTRATEPHAIVHANAAYFQLTGQTAEPTSASSAASASASASSTIIGRLLTNVLEYTTPSLTTTTRVGVGGQQPQPQTLSLQTCASLSDAGHDAHVSVVSSGSASAGGRPIECRITVSPVLAVANSNKKESQNSASLTHFLIELEESTTTSGSNPLQGGTTGGQVSPRQEEEFVGKGGRYEQDSTAGDFLGMTVVG